VPLTTVLFVLAFRPAQLVFVRHCETVANATGRYQTSTLNAFSQKGLTQAAQLTAQLQRSSFDAILVSPSPRALKTVAPYLQRTDQKAEVWPELYECCHQKGAARQKPPSSTLPLGPQIQWPQTFDGLFSLRQDGGRLIEARNYADGIRQIQMAYRRLLSEYSGSGKTVLIVGHSIQGGKMISLLTGGRAVQLNNAKPIRLVEIRPGHFAVL
jgi:broad specificity phosphatase PhoE